MKRRLMVTAALALCTSACKGKVEVKPDPKTEKQLSDCETALKDKKSYIKTLEKRVSDAELEGGGSVVVQLKGNLDDDAIMEISGAQGPHARVAKKDPRGNAKDEELYKEFVSQLQRSRPSIKKCYQNALKKDTRLQARSVTLNIQVDYRTSGKVSNATFNPRISQHFNRCMQGVANRWDLPAMPRKVSFNYRQLLTPQ